MRRKLAMLAVFIMVFNMFFTTFDIDEVYGNTITPSIVNIVIYEEVTVVGTSKQSNFFVEFNGLLLNNIDTIVVNNGGVPSMVLSSSDFVQRTNNRILYKSSESGVTVSSILGTGNISFDLISGENLHLHTRDFNISPPEMIKVETINQMGHTAWPIFINRGNPLEIGYSNIPSLTPDDFDLLIGRVGGSSTKVTYLVQPGYKILVQDTNNAPTGLDLDLIFEKRAADNSVAIRYIVKKGVSITRPLELTNVSVSPLKGTKGTIVRIKANEWQQLAEGGTRVYIDGKEAKRNIGIFNADGTFTYDGNKKGLEVIVPDLGSAGPKTITIVNNDGDIYEFGSKFDYEVAQGPVLKVVEVDPNKGNTNQIIDVEVRAENLVAVNNINIGTGVTIDQAYLGTDIGTGEDRLRYYKKSDDLDSYYIRYKLSNGSYIERKVTVNIARKATITHIPLNVFHGTGAVSMQLKTALVQDAGIYDVIVRTETIHYSLVGETLVELDTIVEQTAFPSFTFQPDTTTPVITNITPNKGPYNENIVATITGSNFVVVEDGGNRYFPTVIIGKGAIANDEKYKVIFKDTDGKSKYYYSSNANGLPVPDEADIHEIVGADFVVLDANNNVVDGQLRKIGTKIKLTIPEGTINYSGFADIRIYNPTSTGGRGGSHTRENIFEYVTPGPGIIFPIIDSVTPDKVAVGKQEQVVIKGKYFQPDAILTVDGEVVNRTIDVATGTITFNAPPGRVGKTFIQVINLDGGMATHGFEYIQTHTQPHIQSIIPNVGGMGSLVIIKGSGFFVADENGPNDDYKIGTKVYIDGKDVNLQYFKDGDGNLILDKFENFYFPDEDGNFMPIYGPDGEKLESMGSNVAVIDHQTIYVLIPDPKDGSKPFFMNTPLNVRVVNPDLGSHSVNGGFRFIDVVTRPKIDSITPDLGDYRGGNIAEIQGDYFLENVKVYFGTQEAQVYRRSNNAKTIWVYVPPYGGNMGSDNEKLVPVTVQNSNGGSYTKFDGYRYVNPGYDAKITKLTPAIGNTAGGDRILISGINFRAEASADGTQLVNLPAVYFGGVKVPEDKITFVMPPKAIYDKVETTDMIVVEFTPPNPAGKVDVTVINFDGATATLKNGFEYRSKQPAITQVLPNQGSVLGGSEITIIGRDFVSNGLHVVFGNEAGKADVLSGQAMVRLGDIIVRYNAYATGDNITLYYKDLDNPLEVYLGASSTPTSSLNIIEEEEFKIARIPWKDVPGEGNSNLADENIKIEIKDSNLVVTRRLGVIKRIEGEDRITLITPPAVSVGQTQVRVFNYDGKNATSNFTYTNPFRTPVITKVTPVTTVQVDVIAGVSYTPPLSIDIATAAPSGGSPLIIEGQNFRAGVKVYIGNVQATVRTKSANDDELIIIVPPAVASTVGQYLRILVLNEDGGFAYGDVVPTGQSRNPYYFQYITEGSFPKINAVTPEKGPVTGGTKITIKGTEFKDQDTFGNPKEVMVLIGGIPVPQQNVTYINPQTLEVIVPAGRVGPQTIEVVNYDNGRAVANDAFTYISQPNISLVNPGKLFANDINTEVTITGTMFQPGAKVYIGSTLVAVNDVKQGDLVHATGIRGVTTDHKNREMSIVGGVPAASVTVEDETTIKVKFNEALDLTNSHIIIINPDGGLSSEYKDFQYQIPIPTRPLVLEAIPGVEASVMLIWSDSDPEVLNRADRYEIYGKKSNETNYTFIGDTRDHEFLVKGLEINTNYTFMVRAMNRYGSALEFAEVKVRTLNQREDQQLREKLEALEKENNKQKKEGQEVINGNNVIKTIGTEEIPVGIPPYVIDFSLVKYKNLNSYTVAIPVEVVLGLNRKVTITDGKMSFTFLPRDLYTREVSAVPAKDIEDAHVRITFTRMTGKDADSILTAIGRTQRRASDIYDITFQLQAGKNISDINAMIRNGDLSIKFDSLAYPQANKDKLFIGQYNLSSHSFTKLADGTDGSIRNKGRYMLLANR